MSDDPITIRCIELIGRHLLPGEQIEEELALLTAQPPSKRAVIEERLEILDGYLSSGVAGVKAADAAATEMGVSRRSFYRLIAKLSELGPVRALSLGFRNAPRQAPTKDGLSEPAETAIRQVLEARPDEPIFRVNQFVKAESIRIGFEYPGETAIRRRVHALRQSGLVPSLVDQFGAQLVVDQCPIDLTVSSDAQELVTVTLIIDRSTRLICGCGFSVLNDFGLGLMRALRDSEQRIVGFADSSFPVAARISEVRWVVPPAVEYAATAMKPDSLPKGRRPDINVLASGPRRHGEAILRLLGDRFGVYNFRRLAMEAGKPLPSSASGVDVMQVGEIVGYCADGWNRRIVSRLPKTNASAELRRLSRVTTDIDQLFAPVVAMINEREHDRFFELVKLGRQRGVSRIY